jgi:hypothetical protein
MVLKSFSKIRDIKFYIHVNLKNRNKDVQENKKSMVVNKTLRNRQKNRLPCYRQPRKPKTYYHESTPLPFYTLNTNGGVSLLDS